MTFPRKKKLGLMLAAAGLLLGAFVGLAFWSARRAFERARASLADENELRFVTRRLTPVLPAGVEPLGTSAGFKDAAFFHDRLYLGGPAKLLAYSTDGKIVARYCVGLELPSAPMVALAAGMAADATEPELYVATAGAGLLALGEQGLRQVIPEKETLRRLTAVLALPNGRLLLGTERNGVLVYDGKHLALFHPALAAVRVTALAGDESSFWVGTIDQGVLHWHAGEVDRFGEAEGLPDPRVVSEAVDGGRAFVGTPLGVAEFHDGQFRRVLASGFFANALLVRGQRLLVGTLDEGTLEVPLTSQGSRPLEPRGEQLPGEVERLIADRDRCFALTGDGFFALDEHAAGWRQIIASENSSLADRDVSALAFDAAGRLWVGYFDRGLDILPAGAERATHVENDHVFSVNRIVYDRRNDGMDVATANGLVLFDGEGRQRQVLGREQGLIADHVSDVALTADGMTLATPAGITILSPSGARSIYAFQGLINNHVYALASEGSRLLAGTLGGLSILDDGRVLANYTTANSGLRHNWITAIVPVDDDWFVGTYGAGILRLTRHGDWETFADATGQFDVNNNAMVAATDRVYAGTQGRGLHVYERASGRWSGVTTGLPSLNVTAVAAHDGYLYVGTDNGLVRISEESLRNP